jgi:hypothetical protein
MPALSWRGDLAGGYDRGCMTTQQLHLFNCIYLVVLVVVAVLTRATGRRIAGALAGGGAAGVVALDWWHSWRLDLTGPRRLTDTTSNSRPNSPSGDLELLSLESHNANSRRRR